MKDIQFYRSQFWRLQKQFFQGFAFLVGFIGHNFGDYKNAFSSNSSKLSVLSVTILETTKTENVPEMEQTAFYRSQFWRLQKLFLHIQARLVRFIGHNFGDYKNVCPCKLAHLPVLSVTILETTKTSNSIS